jgi:hypothetical protein
MCGMNFDEVCGQFRMLSNGKLVHCTGLLVLYIKDLKHMSLQFAEPLAGMENARNAYRNLMGGTSVA